MTGSTTGLFLLAASALVASVVGGPAAAVGVIAAPALGRVLRSPDRTFELLYAAVFCAMGALVGR